MKYECIDNHNADWLVIGKVYNIEEGNPNGPSWVSVIHDDGSKKSSVARYRFKPLHERRNDIIDKILN
jgi:hypothetical protein